MDHYSKILLLTAAPVFEPESQEDNDDDDDPTVRAVRTRKRHQGYGARRKSLSLGQILKKTIILSSSEAESVTAEPWQEGGSKMAGNASVVAIGVGRARYIMKIV